MTFNDRYLQGPPILIHKYDIALRKAREYDKIFTDHVTDLKSLQALNAERAMLQKFIYRMKCPLIKDKVLMFVEKLNRTLRRLAECNLQQKIVNHSRLIQLSDSDDADIVLPTRNLLDYILVRMQGVYALCVRIVELSQQAALYAQYRIGNIDTWRPVFVAYAAISRIWQLATKLLNITSDFYQHLLPFRSILINTTAEWLPVGYVFPDNLRNWLGPSADCINAAYYNDGTYSAILTEAITIDSDTDVEVTSEYIDVDTIVSSQADKLKTHPPAFKKIESKSTQKPEKMERKSAATDDDGIKQNMVLNKNERKKMRKHAKMASGIKQQKEVKNLSFTDRIRSKIDIELHTANKDLFDCLKTVQDVKSFMIQESCWYRRNKKRAVFGHLDGPAWLKLQTTAKSTLADIQHKQTTKGRKGKVVDSIKQLFVKEAKTHCKS